MAKMTKKNKRLLTYALIGGGLWYFMKKDKEKKDAEVAAAANAVAQSGLGTYLTIGR